MLIADRPMTPTTSAPAAVSSVCYYVACSLDGFIAAEDGGTDWLPPIDPDGEDFGFGEFFAGIDALVMGRHTYEQSLALLGPDTPWPYGDTPCWVMSRKPLNPPQASVRVSAASPRSVLAAAHAAGQQRVWLMGGAALARSFRAEGLITDYIVSIVPVILGKGIPLLQADETMTHLELLSSRQLAGGLVQLHYRRKRPPVHA